jgi:hypothetical protein
LACFDRFWGRPVAGSPDLLVNVISEVLFQPACAELYDLVSRSLGPDKTCQP